MLRFVESPRGFSVSLAVASYGLGLIGALVMAWGAAGAHKRRQKNRAAQEIEDVFRESRIRADGHAEKEEDLEDRWTTRRFWIGVLLLFAAALLFAADQGLFNELAG